MKEEPGGEHVVPQHERFVAIGAAMIVGTAALMVLGLQPILLGALVDEGRLGTGGLGGAATAEILAIAIGTWVGASLLNRGRLRAKCLAICVALAAIDFASALPSFALPVAAVRAAAGLLEGLSLSAAILIMTHNRRPDRLSGIFLGAQTIPQVIAAYLLPTQIIPRWGAAGGFMILGGLAALAALAALCLVDRIETNSAAPGRALQWSPAAIILSLAAFTQFAGIGAAWNYLERLAVQHGLSGEIIGIAISGSLLFQIGGAWMAAWLGWRAGYRLALVVGCVAQAGVVITLSLSGAPAMFVAASCAFGLFWLALQPFQVRYAIALDNSRSLAVFLTPVALVGLSAGPLLVSPLAEAADLRWCYLGSSALLIASGVLYLSAVRVQSRRQAITSEIL
ncbi:hypothetical protein [Sphingopyxis granuli]|jgi:hypothetical protein|uniref:hypothetical protein n=1 Tax=Sphingopyxis granuli TaxID=267128 RepID=UPI00301DF3CD